MIKLDDNLETSWLSLKRKPKRGQQLCLENKRIITCTMKQYLTVNIGVINYVTWSIIYMQHSTVIVITERSFNNNDNNDNNNNNMHR